MCESAGEKHEKHEIPKPLVFNGYWSVEVEEFKRVVQELVGDRDALRRFLRERAAYAKEARNVSYIRNCLELH